MRMIVLFVRGVFHGPVAGHRQLARAKERITVWTRDIFEEILGEELALDFNPEPVGLFDNLDPLRRGERQGGGRNEVERDQCGDCGDGPNEV